MKGNKGETSLSRKVPSSRTGSKIDSRSEPMQQLETDQDELVENQRAVTEVSDEYRVLYDSAPVGYLTVARDGTITTANAMASEILRVREEKLAGKNLFHLFLWEDRIALQRHFHDVVSATRPKSCDLRLYPNRPPTEVRLVSIAGRRKNDEFFVVISDITEQREARQKARDSQRLSVICAASATLAHEIANPLNGIFSTLQRMERDATRNISTVSDLVTHIQNIKVQVERLRSLVNDIRELARPPRLRCSRLFLNNLIEHCVSLEGTRLSERRIEVNRRFASQLQIQGDETKLSEAIVNLIENAMDAMRSGGILTIFTYDTNSNVCLEIKNTGQPLPQNIDVFEPFVTSKKHGLGIGLTVVKQIISGHGGSITYHSSPWGTTFHVGLPGV